MLKTAAIGLTLLSGALIFLLSVQRIQILPMRLVTIEMATALPRPVQVLLSGGDRFLAANVNVFRVLTLSGPNQTAAKMHVQALIQKDAAWLNPAHEDNYYVAAAALPWNNEFDAGDEVLAQAVEARSYDFAPPFFRGFNHFYFRQDPLTGAKYVQLAAERSDSETNRQAFETIAARWTEKGSTPEDALRLLDGMQKSTRLDSVKKYLEGRMAILRDLIRLRDAASRYQSKFGHVPARMSDLLDANILTALPKDPPGQRFLLNAEGVPILNMLPPQPIKHD